MRRYRTKHSKSQLQPFYLPDTSGRAGKPNTRGDKVTEAPGGFLQKKIIKALHPGDSLREGIKC